MDNSRSSFSFGNVKPQDVYFSALINSMIQLDRDKVMEITDMLNKHENGRIFTMGNGGSATTASHLAGDLFKTCGFDAFCLSDSNYLITAVANDRGYDHIFSDQVENVICDRDILIAISGSGKSSNIIEAVETAKKYEAKVIGLTGFDGGLLKDICDICLIVPSNTMEIIEDVHLTICHCIVRALCGN